MEQLLLINPKKRKTSRKRKLTAKRPKRNPVALNPRTLPQRKRRRNPMKTYRATSYRRSKKPGLLTGTILPAGIAATGALGLDILYGLIPLPETIKTGQLRHVVKGAAAIGLGMVAGMVVNKSTARAMSQGALTVVLHEAMKELTERFIPNLAMSGVGEISDIGYQSYAQNAGYVNDNGVGVYLPDENAAPSIESPGTGEYVPEMSGMGAENVYL